MVTSGNESLGMTPKNTLGGAVVVVASAIAVTACAGGTVTPTLVSAAQKRWPEASQESLERGRSLYVSKCQDCHALPAPKGHSAEEWPKYMEKMGKLASLDTAGTELVLRYVIAARDAE